MAFNLPLNSKFNWGDSVKVKNSAPQEFEPDSIGSICGMTQIDSNNAIKDLERNLTKIVYLVEFKDGHTIEIPEDYLDFFSKYMGIK